MKTQCKKIVHSGFKGLIKTRCERNATKGDYCWQHDPKAEKQRAEHSEKKLAATPFFLINKRKQ